MQHRSLATGLAVVTLSLLAVFSPAVRAQSPGPAQTVPATSSSSEPQVCARPTKLCNRCRIRPRSTQAASCCARRAYIANRSSIAQEERIQPFLQPRQTSAVFVPWRFRRACAPTFPGCYRHGRYAGRVRRIIRTATPSRYHACLSAATNVSIAWRTQERRPHRHPLSSKIPFGRRFPGEDCVYSYALCEAIADPSACATRGLPP